MIEEDQYEMINERVNNVPEYAAFDGCSVNLKYAEKAIIQQRDNIIFFTEVK